MCARRVAQKEVVKLKTGVPSAGEQNREVVSEMGLGRHKTSLVVT